MGFEFDFHQCYQPIGTNNALEDRFQVMEIKHPFSKLRLVLDPKNLVEVQLESQGHVESTKNIY